tara:strand:+ start:163180 stop:164568 length:1389 start_codon:yes stop_codon:yes gene_type:complete
MKKQLLTLITCATSGMLFGQMGQIANGGFENWTTETIADTLLDWDDSNGEQPGPATVFQSTDAADAMYSAEIGAATFGPNDQDTTFGYIYHGSIGSNGPDGGITYADNFDEVQYQFKADLAVDDTLYLLIIRFNSGVPGGLELYPAAFGQVSTWTQGSISVATGTQDELFIGFVMGDPFGDAAPQPVSKAWIDDVRMFDGGSATTDLPDPSLENWNTISSENPDDWYTLNELIVQAGLPANVTKTTDAASGSFAAEMTVLYEPQNQDTIGSIVSLGPINIQNMNPFEPAPYEAMPVELTGSYKYAPSNLDAGAGLLLEFYQGGSVLYIDYQAFTTNATYTSFTLPITLSGTPDSVLMYAFAGENPGSVLHLDDLSFNGGDVGLEEQFSTQTMVYPNPAQENIHLRTDANSEFRLVDITGKEIKSGTTESLITTFDVSKLNPGIYLFQLTRDGKIQTIKFVKK